MRQTFNDSFQAREWEHKVLRRLKVIHNDRWLNLGTGKSIPPMLGLNHWTFGKGFSEEHKQKLRKPKSEEHKQKLRKPKSEEHKQKLSNARKGKPGHLHSEETKQKLREINLGKKHTEEAKIKIKEKRKLQILTDNQIETLKTANLGKKFTAEHRQKISAAQKGKPKSEEHKKALRKPKSQESKKKMSESKTGTVQCLDIQTGIKARIPSELFHSDKTRYFAHSSKTYKAS